MTCYWCAHLNRAATVTIDGRMLASGAGFCPIPWQEREATWDTEVVDTPRHCGLLDLAHSRCGMFEWDEGRLMDSAADGIQ